MHPEYLPSFQTKENAQGKCCSRYHVVRLCLFGISLTAICYIIVVRYEIDLLFLPKVGHISSKLRLNPPIIDSETKYAVGINDDMTRSQNILDKNEDEQVSEKKNLNKRTNIHNDHELKFAWLMSFPNSGTTFTLKMTSSVSQTTMASNYGKEHIDDLGNPLIFGAEYPYGPFRAHSNLPLSKGFTLTKTHCGGTCTFCHPNKYILTEWSFMQNCLTGKRMIEHGNGDPIKDYNTYDQSLIKKAVHLIRNPLDNIISRYHLEWNKNTKRHNLDWLENHPRNETGFQSWCKEMDEAFLEEEMEDHYKGIDDLHNVPCHAEFFRYTQWHNLAFEIIKKMEIPFLIVHYEDYDENFDHTLNTIIAFLDLKIVSDPVEYSRNLYPHYFTNGQRQHILDFIKHLSSKTTWDTLNHRYKYDEK